MNKLLITVVSVLVVVTAGVTYFFTGHTESTDVPVQVAGLSGPDIPSPYFSYGGVRFWGGRNSNLTQATTTVCAIQSPAATSTLVYGGIRLDVSSTTASTVRLAKSATAFATTTSLGSASVAANATSEVISLRTAAGGGALAETFGPNTWFVVGMSGGTGTFSPSGSCFATWVQI